MARARDAAIDPQGQTMIRVLPQEGGFDILINLDWAVSINLARLHGSLKGSYIKWREKKLATPENFVHLHNHSTYSLLDGASSIDRIAEMAVVNGQPAIALTDHGYMFGAYKHWAACKKRGIKGLMGVEAYLVDDVNKKYVAEDGSARRWEYHQTLIAQNQTGWENLCKLMTIACRDHFHYVPRIDHKLLFQHKEGIICLTGCFKGMAAHYLQHRPLKEGESKLPLWLEYNPDKAREFLRMYKSEFGDRLYGEVMNIDYAPYNACLPELCQLLDEEGIPKIATNDCFPAGTLILTKEGWRPIESVGVDDQVWTHRNRWRAVTATNVRPADHLLEVKSKVGTYAFRCTANHRVLCGKSSSPMDLKVPVKIDWVAAGELVSGDWLMLPKVMSLGLVDEELTHIDLLEMVQPSNDHRGLKYDADRDELVSRHRMGKSIIRIPRMLPVTDDLLFILGRHVADGHVDKGGNQIGCAFHVEEREQQERWAAYFSRLGMKVRRAQNGKGVSLTLSSVVFRQLLAKMCGIGARDKHLPHLPGFASYFGCWSRRQLAMMLCSYLDGDGHKCLESNSGLATCATVSERLAWELSAAMGSLGIPVIPMEKQSVTKHKNPRADSRRWSKQYVLNWEGIHKKLFACLALSGQRITPHGGKRFADFGEWWGVRVESVRRLDGQCNVYNFSVEDDESYVARGYVVHNCHYEREEDAILQAVLTRIANQKVDEIGGSMKEKGVYFIRSRAEVAAGSPFITADMLDRTCQVADRCDLTFERKGFLFAAIDKTADPDWPGFRQARAEGRTAADGRPAELAGGCLNGLSNLA